MQALTGQYECVHPSGVGFEYFTARIDRLTLQANGRCVFIFQERTRIGHAARSLLSGQQVDANAPETRREGRYSSTGNTITFYMDDGKQLTGQLISTGIQIGSDVFQKVSDSTFLPPTHRLQSNMEDIAKGMKIAGAIGGATIKAVKAIQDTLQNAQGSSSSTGAPTHSQGAGQSSQGYQATQTPPSAAPFQGAQATPAAPAAQDDETHFCDQCGAPVRPGKHFCSRCGARLP